jgi:molybdopterin synthase catalytic subunit
MLNDFFELTTEPLEVGAIARRVRLPKCGATVTLDGYVRQWTKGRETLYLVYEAYEPMAVREMGKLVEQAHEKFEIASVGIAHRFDNIEQSIYERLNYICMAAKRDKLLSVGNVIKEASISRQRIL